MRKKTGVNRFDGAAVAQPKFRNVFITFTCHAMGNFITYIRSENEENPEKQRDFWTEASTVFVEEPILIESAKNFQVI